MTTVLTELLEKYYVTEEELANALGVGPERLRDLRSHHITGKQKFINFIKPSNKQVFYHIDDVMEWLHKQKVYSFGINKDDPDE